MIDHRRRRRTPPTMLLIFYTRVKLLASIISPWGWNFPYRFASSSVVVVELRHDRSSVKLECCVCALCCRVRIILFFLCCCLFCVISVHFVGFPCVVLSVVLCRFLVYRASPWSNSCRVGVLWVCFVLPCAYYSIFFGAVVCFVWFPVSACVLDMSSPVFWSVSRRPAD